MRTGKRVWKFVEVTRKRVWKLVEVRTNGDWAGRLFDISILGLVLLNVLAIMLESVESVHDAYAGFFKIFEYFSVTIFTAEYFARIWSCVESPLYHDPVRGRLRYFFKFMLLVDLVAIAPFYLECVLPFFVLDLRYVRVLRILRILRVFKVGRYSTALRLIMRVFSSKKDELVMSTAFMVLLLILSSCIMYNCEHTAQPSKFPNIPATMWWAVVTLTSVGYGDVYPITSLGKVLSGVMALLGIGMCALPAGIIASGFVEEIQGRKSTIPSICPHCGKELK